MVLKLISDYEIFLRIRRVSAEKNIHFSPTECAFFASLVRFIAEHGTYDEEEKAHFIQLSYRDLSREIGVSPLVVSSISKFADCGLLKSVPEKKKFRPLGAGEFLLNKPNVTFVDLSLYFCE